MRRSAFTLIEVLLVIGVMGVIAGAIIPAYHDYQIRSDLDLAEDVVREALHRAQSLAQIGQDASEWGYSIEQEAVYQGSDYESRDAAFDELFAFSDGITATGLDEVTYSQVYGVPDPTGDIILTALNGDRRVIEVSDDNVLGPPAPIPVQFKVLFNKIQNSGGGNFQPYVYVGTGAVEYEEGIWIPLTDEGGTIIDTDYVLGVLGLAVQRQDGFLRVTNHGGIGTGGKEIVDARITLDEAVISSVQNDTGTDETENPFDGNVNNGVGGDEVTTAPDGKSVLFQTRTTNYGDSILIYWSPSG